MGYGLGAPGAGLKDRFDHHQIFEARDHLDRTTTVRAGHDVDFQHPLQWSGAILNRRRQTRRATGRMPGVQAAARATKSHQSLGVIARAANARKAVLQTAALQIAFELALALVAISPLRTCE